MSDGISGFGTTLSGSVTSSVSQITSISIPGVSVDDLDVTTMASANAFREFIAGLKDAGELSVELLYEKSAYDAQLAAVGGAAETWTVTFPDESIFTCSGYIKAAGQVEAPMDGPMTSSLTIKLSGEPSFTEGS